MCFPQKCPDFLLKMPGILDPRIPPIRRSVTLIWCETWILRRCSNLHRLQRYRQIFPEWLINIISIYNNLWSFTLLFMDTRCIYFLFSLRALGGQKMTTCPHIHNLTFVEAPCVLRGLPGKTQLPLGRINKVNNSMFVKL